MLLYCSWHAQITLVSTWTFNLGIPTNSWITKKTPNLYYFLLCAALHFPLWDSKNIYLRMNGINLFLFYSILSLSHWFHLLIFHFRTGLKLSNLDTQTSTPFVARTSLFSPVFKRELFGKPSVQTTDLEIPDKPSSEPSWTRIHLATLNTYLTRYELVTFLQKNSLSET